MSDHEDISRDSRAEEIAELPSEEEQIDEFEGSESVANMKVAKIQLKRRLTSQRRGLMLAIRDEVLSAKDVRQEFEVVEGMANEVNHVLESLVGRLQAEQKKKAVDAAIAELEEVAETLAKLEQQVEKYEEQQTRTRGTHALQSDEFQDRYGPFASFSEPSGFSAGPVPFQPNTISCVTSDAAGAAQFSGSAQAVTSFRWSPSGDSSNHAPVTSDTSSATVTPVVSSAVTSFAALSVASANVGPPQTNPPASVSGRVGSSSSACQVMSAVSTGSSALPSISASPSSGTSSTYISISSNISNPVSNGNVNASTVFTGASALPGNSSWSAVPSCVSATSASSALTQAGNTRGLLSTSVGAPPRQSAPVRRPVPTVQQAVTAAPVVPRANFQQPQSTAQGVGPGSYPAPRALQPYQPASFVVPPAPTADVFNKMRSVSIPVFDGDKRSYELWKATFLACVDSAPISPTLKLLQLRQYVAGEALKCIERLGFAPDSYSKALDRLERKFGGARRQVMVYLDELERFKPLHGERIKAHELEKFADLLEVAVTNLKAAGRQSELEVGTLYARLQQKLPEELLTRYHRWLYEHQRQEGVEALLDWVNLEAEFHTTANETIAGLSPSRYVHGRERGAGRGHSYHAAECPGKATSPACPVCSQNHKIWICKQFKDMDIDKRWIVAKTHRLCYRCLGKGHRGADCPRKRKCGVDRCSESHNYLLHRAVPTKPKPSSTTEGGEATATARTTTATNIGVQSRPLSLRTLPVVLRNGDRSLRVTALLDDGSTQSYVNTEVADQLKLQGPVKQVSISTLNGAVESFQSMPVDLLVESVDGKFISPFSAITTSCVTGTLKPYDWSIQSSQYQHLQDIPFEQPTTQLVDVLIGLDHAELHYSMEEVKGDPGEPVARKTALGWTCVGPVDGSAVQPRTHFSRAGDNTLETLVRRLWEMEEPQQWSPLAANDQQLLLKAEAATKYRNGRYTVKLPWKSEPPDKNSSYELALRRLCSTEKRLQKDPEVAKEYCRVLKRHEDTGYVTAVKPEATDGWFLPHFPITRPEATTTKVRVVFDASAKCGGTSLNDYLHAGPKLQRELPHILLRFRAKPVAIVADVAEMYLQIELCETDRKYHRFLWRDMNTSQRPTVYEYQRVVFGVNSSPFLAQMVSQRHAEQLKRVFPRAAEAVLKSTYMDDTMDSTEDDKDAVQLYQDLNELWHRAGMHARKWISNSTKLLQLIPPEDRAKHVNLQDSTLPSTKTLGVRWEAETDVFTFKCRSSSCSVLTKRAFLKILATLFDPLGFVLPFAMSGRILFQAMWVIGVQWDQPLPDSLGARASQWCAELQTLETVAVPRCLRLSSPEVIVSTGLHIFGDASQEAYGAVAYIRHQYQSGKVTCRPVASKGKVAPIHSTSIPRLELNAAVVAVRLAVSVGEVLAVPESSWHWWTDSMNVLWWVRNRSRQFKPFIANRVSEIQASSQPSQWHYVPSECNPADVVSRGSTAAELVQEGKWWNGPQYLLYGQSQWPQQPHKLTCPAVPEVRSTCKETGASFFTVTIGRDWKLECSNFSSWRNAVRLLAWVLRFVSNCRTPVKERQVGSLSPEEVTDAELSYIITAQQESFPEYALLRKGKAIPATSKLSSLCPRLDEDGVMRVEGRTQNAEFLPDATRHPIVLPRHSWVTQLIVKDQHEVANHSAGVNHICSLLMQRFWIIAGREAVRECEQRCTECRKRKAKPVTPVMAPLPKMRLQSPHRAFGRVAVDYAGPFATIQGRGQRRSKRYLCLFTCLVCRAVHLEMAYSLDTSSFLNAFERMSNRRGLPNEVLSDNGTNFVGGQRELNELQQEQSKLQAKYPRVRWHFIPPGAPHFGGVHETMVKAAKKAIHAVLSDASVTDEELQTAFSSAESLLNSRPLTAPSADIRDDLPLTPNHFLVGRVEQLSVGSSSNDYRLQQRWRRVQELVTHFWHRWMKEWVPGLNRRAKWSADERNVAIGDIVLVVAADTPRGKWPLGRVTEVIPGQDGNVRVARVLVGGKTVTRPVVRLCPVVRVETVGSGDSKN